MFKNLILGTLCFTTTLTFGATKVSGINDITMLTAASASNCYVYDLESATNYIESKYGDTVSNVYEVIENKVLIENVKNFNQDTLNEKYNSEYYNIHKTNISGTCTIVACLGLLNYYGNSLGEFSISESTDDAFAKIFNNCYASGYTTLTDGTADTKVNNCVTKTFSIYGSNREGDTNWWYLYDNIKDSVNSGNPIIFDLTDHSTVVCGLTTYSFNYEKKKSSGALWWKKTWTETVSETVDFVIVNEGWGRKEKSIVPTSMIKNILSDQQVCWAH